MSGLDMAKARMLMQVMAGDTYRNYPSLPEAICFAREAATMLPAAIERITELEAENKSLKQWADAYVKQRIEIAAPQENNQYLLEMEASHIEENEVLREQIDSWIADRDRWIARYEAAQKEIAALQERIGKLEEALKIEKGQNLLDEELLP